jgi:hypothetical protein
MWSKNMQDAGSFTIFHSGNLAIQSGAYRPGYGSVHERFYGVQSVAHNTLTITDPNDYYQTEPFSAYNNTGGVTTIPMPNDGGQRRAGSPYTSFGQFPFPSFYSPDCDTGCMFPSPSTQDPFTWQAMYPYYHMGTMLSFVGTPQYTYAAVDITPAYNNQYSGTTPNTSNRTNRVSSVIRNMLYIPPGYVVIYDEVNSTAPTFKKKWLLHSINQPIISGNRYQINRTENANMQPYNPGTTTQYNGKLIGWMVTPTGGAINVIGGPGKEFWIEDPKNPGTGTNYNICQQGQCSGGYTFLAPNTPDVIQPDPKYGGVEPGSWRIEESPTTSENQDYFLNVMLATDYNDANVPASVTGISGANTMGATWSDSQNTYTVSFNNSGSGGHITVTGTLNINADLPASTPASTPNPPLTPTPPSTPNPPSTSNPPPSTPNPPPSTATSNPCDLNGDGVVNSADVQLAINQALGISACTNADLRHNGSCDIIDVQRVINAVLGGACVTSP